METGKAAVVGVVALFLVVGTAGAFVAGVGPFDTGDEDIGEFPTQTPTESGSSGGGGDSGGSGDGSGSSGDDAGQDLPPYYFSVTDTKKCGQTCRDVTVELTNNRDRSASNVNVYVRIFAGNETGSKEPVWQGKEEVGGMDAGETTTATKRVKLSYSEGFKVRQNDGWITIQTTVRSEDVTRTFTERRDVL